MLRCCFLLPGLPRGEVISGKLQLSPSPRHMLDGMMDPPHDLLQSTDANSSNLVFTSILTVPNTTASPDTIWASRATSRTIFLVGNDAALSSWLFNCCFAASSSCLTSGSLPCPRGDCLVPILAPLLLFTPVDEGGGEASPMSVCGPPFLARGETCRVSCSGCIRGLDRGLFALEELMVETGDKLVAMLPRFLGVFLWRRPRGATGSTLQSGELSTVMLYTTCGETGTQGGASRCRTARLPRPFGVSFVGAGLSLTNSLSRFTVTFNGLTWAGSTPEEYTASL